MQKPSILVGRFCTSIEFPFSEMVTSVLRRSFVETFQYLHSEENRLFIIRRLFADKIGQRCLQFIFDGTLLYVITSRKIWKNIFAVGKDTDVFHVYESSVNFESTQIGAYGLFYVKNCFKYPN